MILTQKKYKIKFKWLQGYNFFRLAHSIKNLKADPVMKYVFISYILDIVT